MPYEKDTESALDALASKIQPKSANPLSDVGGQTKENDIAAGENARLDTLNKYHRSAQARLDALHEQMRAHVDDPKTSDNESAFAKMADEAHAIRSRLNYFEGVKDEIKKGEYSKDPESNWNPFSFSFRGNRPYTSIK